MEKFVSSLLGFIATFLVIEAWYLNVKIDNMHEKLYKIELKSTYMQEKIDSIHEDVSFMRYE